jgi:hypothetical protein
VTEGGGSGAGWEDHSTRPRRDLTTVSLQEPQGDYDLVNSLAPTLVDRASPVELVLTF